MSAAALLLAAAAAAAPPPPGAVLDSAQVTVTVLKPVAVRQSGGPVSAPDNPRFQLTRRDGLVLVEFQ
jgi:hypothetical protein